MIQDLAVALLHLLERVLRIEWCNGNISAVNLSSYQRDSSIQHNMLNVVVLTMLKPSSYGSTPYTVLYDRPFFSRDEPERIPRGPNLAPDR